MKYDVFISCKSEDYPMAKYVYQYLTTKNYKAFLADEELRKKGNTDYGKMIDDALDSAKHLIVVTSNPDYVKTTYVESEWRIFIEEKRAGRKPGNILTILKNTPVSSLPISLRHWQSFTFVDYRNIIDFLPREIVEVSQNVNFKTAEQVSELFGNLYAVSNNIKTIIKIIKVAQVKGLGTGILGEVLFGAINDYKCLNLFLKYRNKIISAKSKKVDNITEASYYWWTYECMKKTFPDLKLSDILIDHFVFECTGLEAKFYIKKAVRGQLVGILIDGMPCSFFKANNMLYCIK